MVDSLGEIVHVRLLWEPNIPLNFLPALVPITCLNSLKFRSFKGNYIVLCSIVVSVNKK